MSFVTSICIISINVILYLFIQHAVCVKEAGVFSLSAVDMKQQGVWWLRLGQNPSFPLLAVCRCWPGCRGWAAATQRRCWVCWEPDERRFAALCWTEPTPFPLLLCRTLTGSLRSLDALFFSVWLAYLLLVGLQWRDQPGKRVCQWLIEQQRYKNGQGSRAAFMASLFTLLNLTIWSVDYR